MFYLQTTYIFTYILIIILRKIKIFLLLRIKKIFFSLTQTSDAISLRIDLRGVSRESRTLALSTFKSLRKYNF